MRRWKRFVLFERCRRWTKTSSKSDSADRVQCLEATRQGEDNETQTRCDLRFNRPDGTYICHHTIGLPCFLSFIVAPLFQIYHTIALPYCRTRHADRKHQHPVQIPNATSFYRHESEHERWPSSSRADSHHREAGWQEYVLLNLCPSKLAGAAAPPKRAIE